VLGSVWDGEPWSSGTCQAGASKDRDRESVAGPTGNRGGCNSGYHDRRFDPMSMIGTSLKKCRGSFKGSIGAVVKLLPTRRPWIDGWGFFSVSQLGRGKGVNRAGKMGLGPGALVPFLSQFQPAAVPSGLHLCYGVIEMGAPMPWYYPQGHNN
jgi:hypothetical protein